MGADCGGCLATAAIKSAFVIEHSPCAVCGSGDNSTHTPMEWRNAVEVTSSMYRIFPSDSLTEYLVRKSEVGALSADEPSILPNNDAPRCFLAE